MARDLRIEVRVDDAELDAWRDAAEREGLTLSAWLRRLATLAVSVRCRDGHESEEE